MHQQQKKIEYFDLATLAARNGAFSADIPGLQLIWDSTSYREYQACPFRYYLSIILGLQSRFRSINLTFGIGFHAALERFHKLRAAGESYESAVHWTTAETYFRQLRTPAEWCLSNWGAHEESIPVYKTDKKKKPQKAPRVLPRTVIAYLDHYSSEQQSEFSNLHTVILSDGTPAVEHSFKFPIPETPFFWGGHLDRLVTKHEQLDLSTDQTWLSKKWAVYNTDYKTTASQLNATYWAQFSPDIQMTGYTLGGKVILPPELPFKGTIVDAVKVGVIGQEFERRLVPRSDLQLTEFLKTFKTDMIDAQRYAEQSDWPMRFTSCRGPYGDCPFRKHVCSARPSGRKSNIRANFIQRTWDPSKER